MKGQRIKKLKNSSELYVLLTILVLICFIQLRSGLFFASNNLVDLMRSMIVPSLYALCAFLAFISTGPDISFPLIAAVSGYLATILTESLSLPLVASFAVAIAAGILMGALNGFIIVRYHFPSLIVTVGTTSIFNGILLGVLNAKRIALPTPMLDFGRSILFSVKDAKTGFGSNLPTAFLFVPIVFLIVYLVLNYTMIGRGVYAIGGDEVSAERAGFNVKAIRLGVFCAIGAIAAIAGVIYTCISQRFLPTEFAGSEMMAIAAVVLGGTRMKGGVGTLTGCVLGTLLITMVSNSLIMLGISVYWQRVFVGIIIIAGTGVSVMRSNRVKKNGNNAEEEL